jgi:hypothetical protein
MIFGIGSFMHGIKIMQLDKFCKIEDTPILPVFLEMFQKVPELHELVEKLARTQNLKGQYDDKYLTQDTKV